MNRRTPVVRYHTRHRRHFVRFDGKFHWVGPRHAERSGADKIAAERELPRLLIKWAEWRERRDVELEQRPTPSRRRTTVAEVVLAFLSAKKADGLAVDSLLHLRASLRRFGQSYGDFAIDRVQARNLQAFKQYLCDFDQVEVHLAPKTINHQLAAARELMTWAGDMGWCPPLNVRAVRLLPVPPPEPRGYTVADVKRIWKKASDRLRPWIALSWMGALRPTETVRLVRRVGRWCEPDGRPAQNQRTARRHGIFLLEFRQSKTPDRRLLLSPRALKYLAVADDRFSRRDSFGQAMRRETGKSPHMLRHGAAQYLARLGVARVEIDAVLGHQPPRVSRSYQPIDFRSLRRTVGRLPDPASL